MKEIKKGEVVFYKKSKVNIVLEVRFEGDSVWLRQQDIANLYGKDRSVITRHINKIFSDDEIDKKSNVHFLHIPNSDKHVAFYSLDVILSVGYRTNSPRAIDFRKWATKTLKEHLVNGFTVNEKRLLQTQNKLKELQGVISASICKFSYI